MPSCDDLVQPTSGTSSPRYIVPLIRRNGLYEDMGIGEVIPQCFLPETTLAVPDACAGILEVNGSAINLKPMIECIATGQELTSCAAPTTPLAKNTAVVTCAEFKDVAADRINNTANTVLRNAIAGLFTKCDGVTKLVPGDKVALCSDIPDTTLYYGIASNTVGAIPALSPSATPVIYPMNSAGIYNAYNNVTGKMLVTGRYMQHIYVTAKLTLPDTFSGFVGALAAIFCGTQNIGDFRYEYSRATQVASSGSGTTSFDVYFSHDTSGVDGVLIYNAGEEFSMSLVFNATGTNTAALLLSDVSVHNRFFRVATS